MTELKTNEPLLQALARASEHKATPQEIREQRISFILGSIKESSGITRERIQRVLDEQEGKV